MARRPAGPGRKILKPRSAGADKAWRILKVSDSCSRPQGPVMAPNAATAIERAKAQLDIPKTLHNRITVRLVAWED